MKKDLIVPGKTYRFADFIRIPFAVCPFYTALRVANRVLSSVTPSIQALVSAAFVDTALAIFAGEAQREGIYPSLLGLILLIAYSNLNWQLISYVNLKSEMKLTRVYRSEMAQKRARLKYRYIEDDGTWDLINRACKDPVEKVNGGFENIMGAGGMVLRVGSLLAILMAQVWWAGIAIVAMSVPLFALAIKGGRQIYEENVKAMKHSRRADYLKGILQGRECVEERSLFGYTGQVNKEWRRKYEAARKIDQKAEMKYFVRAKGAGMVIAALSLLIMFMLLFPLKNGEVTVGMFMALVTSSLRLVQTLSWELSNTMSELAKNTEYLKDLTAFAGLSETDGALDLPEREMPFESLEFCHVSFRYPGAGREILKDFNLRMEKGRHYAFVGVNGAGKTTVTKLLTGLYEDYEGEILINGKELRAYTQAEIKAFFSVVCQDFARYQITMEDNIALGNVLEREEGKIKQAAEAIGLKETMEALPEGIRTPLGKIKEGGTDLSGGQWQRVAIARALYNPAPVRILDEPTAALDPVAESGVYEMFGKVSAGKTTVFITHRLGAARLADEIIVIDGGRVAERGSHEGLLARDGIYARMFEAQRSWYQ